MPDVCGFEITRRIRVHEKFFMLPVLLMSTMSEEDEVRHGYEQGADAYLAKPIDLRILVSCVAQKLAEVKVASTKDPVTGLCSSQYLKLSVQRAIILRHKFALVYIELSGVPNFSREYGVEVRDKALKRMARLITNWANNTETAFFEAGHMGFGHFVCLLESEKADSFCTDMSGQWETLLDRLYPSSKKSSVDGPANGSGHGTDMPDLTMIVCATGSRETGAHTTHEYFDTLSHLRSKALSTGMGGIFLDNRHKF